MTTNHQHTPELSGRTELPLSEWQDLYGLLLSEAIRSEDFQAYATEWPHEVRHHKYFNPKMYERFYRHFPVSSRAKLQVLDIGAGHKPSPVSDVLGERFIEPTHHRPPNQRAIVDRPLVNLDATALPFADQTFDLTILSHVGEHLFPDELKLALKEATRVGERCYLEIPSELYEKKWGHFEHLYNIYWKNGRLIFEVKTAKEWIASLPRIKQHQKYRFFGSNPQDLLTFREEMINNTEDYYLGVFLDRNSLDMIKFRKPRGAIRSREEFEKLKRQYL